jgi:hypothetical protein
MDQSTLEGRTQAGQGKDHKKQGGENSPNTFKIRVIYNGVEKEMEVNPHETVQAVLGRAVHLFHVTAQPHVLSLYNESGIELPDAGKVGEVGIRPGARLLLRPSAVKGGN